MPYGGSKCTTSACHRPSFSNREFITRRLSPRRSAGSTNCAYACKTRWPPAGGFSSGDFERRHLRPAVLALHGLHDGARVNAFMDVQRNGRHLERGPLRLPRPDQLRVQVRIVAVLLLRLLIVCCGCHQPDGRVVPTASFFCGRTARLAVWRRAYCSSVPWRWGSEYRTAIVAIASHSTPVQRRGLPGRVDCRNYEMKLAGIRLPLPKVVLRRKAKVRVIGALSRSRTSSTYCRPSSRILWRM